MGHNFGEMRGDVVDEKVNHFERLRLLRKKLADMPLSSFRAKDLPSLNRIMTPYCDPGECDFELLEAKIAELGNDL